MKGGTLYGIETSQRNGKQSGVYLMGEFDLSRLNELKSVLGDAVAAREEAIVDLSEVTFMDLGCVRELAFYCRIHPDGITLINPSWQALASVKACDLGNWLRFASDKPRKQELSNIA